MVKKEGKNNFLIYHNWSTILRNLDKASAGELIQAICVFQAGEDVEIEDVVLNSVFLMIKEKMIEDKEAYEEKCKVNSENASRAGKKSAEAKKKTKSSGNKQAQTDESENKRTEATASERLKSPTFVNGRQQDTDTDTDNDTDTERDIKDSCRVASTKSLHSHAKKRRADSNIETVKRVIDHLNTKTDSRYRYNSKATLRLINARINEGYTIQDFMKVIDTKASQWLHDPKMASFLRPETLFSPGHFESYLNEKVRSVRDTGQPKEETREKNRFSGVVARLLQETEDRLNERNGSDS